MSRRRPTAKQLEKRRFWKKHIETWTASRLSQSAYCREHQLKLCSFRYWKQKHCRPANSAISLVPVQIAAGFQRPVEPKPSVLRLAINDKYKIEIECGFDPVTLKRLVLTLEQL